MSETYLTTRSGNVIGSRGEILTMNGLPAELRVSEVLIAHAAILTLNGTPVNVVPDVAATQAVCPIGWCVFLNTGTAYTTQLDIQLVDHNTNAVVFGTATNALSGTSDKVTSGTIVSAANVWGDGLNVKVPTANPQVGAAGQYVVIRVAYFLFNS